MFFLTDFMLLKHYKQKYTQYLSKFRVLLGFLISSVTKHKDRYVCKCYKNYEYK